jgi:hypothetical protein
MMLSRESPSKPPAKSSDSDDLKTLILPFADLRSMSTSPGRTKTVDSDYRYAEARDLLSHRVAVLVVGEELVSGTVAIIAPDLVLTALHVVEGWDMRSMTIRFGEYVGDESPIQRRVNGVVEMDAKRDYCVLQLAETIPDNMTPCTMTTFLPNYAYLAHYPHGHRLHISHGEVYNELDNIGAFVNTLELSSGGGYFNPAGELVAIHLSKGVLGMGLVRSSVSILEIVKANPHSILHHLMEDESSSFHVLGEQCLPLQVKSLYVPFGLDTKDVQIPCHEWGYLRQPYTHEVSNERTLYFLAALHLLHTDSLHDLEPGQILTVNAQGKGGQERGVIVEYQGLIDRPRYRLYTVSVTEPITTDDLKQKKKLTVGPSKTNGTEIAAVEISDRLCVDVAHDTKWTKHTLDRFKYAMYQSFFSRRIYRIDYVSIGRLESNFP